MFLPAIALFTFTKQLKETKTMEYGTISFTSQQLDISPSSAFFEKSQEMASNGKEESTAGDTYPASSSRTPPDCSDDESSSSIQSHHTNAITLPPTAQTSFDHKPRMLSNSKRISLWLIPPEPLMTNLSSIQSDIISNHPKDRHLPKFKPHVTLIGGVPISELLTIGEISCQNPERDIHEAAAEIVLRRLQFAFQSHGGITCNFINERGVFAAREPSDDGVGEDIVKWNQSCVSIMERNFSFMKAMQVADEALFSTKRTTCNNNEKSTLSPSSSSVSEDGRSNPTASSVERHFKAPLFEPHFSFVYGNDEHLIPTSLECPPSFISTEMEVMWTHPSSSVHDVEKWETIGRVCLI